VAKTIEHRPQPAATPEPQQPHGRGWRSILLIVSAVVSILVAASAVTGIAVYLYGDSKIQQFECPPGNPHCQAVTQLCTTTCTYLVLGNDSRKGLSEQDKARFGSDKSVPGQRSDTIMLVRLDPRQKKAIVLSFPRDLWVTIPGQGKGKITSAYEGGPYRTADTVSKLTGLTIDHFLSIDLAGFQNVVRAIEGVPICVDRPMKDQKAGLNIPAGCQTLGPEQALAFVRARSVCGDFIPDFSRITRQQQFLRAVLAKLLQPSMILHAGSVIPAVLGNLLVDPGTKNIADIYALVHKLQGVSTGAVDFRSVPGDPFATAQTSDGSTVDIVKLLPKAELLFRRLREGKPLGNLGRALTDTPPSPATIKMRVLDASSGTVATRVFDLLTKAGFDIQPTATAGTLGSQGPAILYAAGAKQQADVVHGFLPSLSLKEAQPGELNGVDVAVVVDSSVNPSAPGAGNPDGSCS
jgi:LCP family protein required for cell wall assembly